MSVSLIAVFIPILLMGGIVGRLFREFAVTLSIAVAVSLLVSLTTTPMMCAQPAGRRGRTAARPALPAQRTWLRRPAPRLRPQSVVDAAAQGVHADAGRRHDCRERGHLRCHSEGLLPAAGHRHARRIRTGAAGHVVPGDVRAARRHRARRAGRSGGRHRRRVHRRRRHGRERRADVHLAEAAGRARNVRGRGHRAAQTPVRERAAHQRLLPGRSGHPGRGSRVERAVSVHASGRQPRRSEPLDTAPDRPAASRSAARRRQQRSRESRLADDDRHRPRSGSAARGHRAGDRRDALRRLWPASGVDDVHRAEPVSRRDGSGAGVRRAPRGAPGHLRALDLGRARPVQHLRRLPA